MCFCVLNALGRAMLKNLFRLDAFVPQKPLGISKICSAFRQIGRSGMPLTMVGASFFINQPKQLKYP